LYCPEPQTREPNAALLLGPRIGQRLGEAGDREICRAPHEAPKVEAGCKDLPVTPQCALLQLSRAAVYRKPKPVRAADLELMRLIDEQYLKAPFYGARKMAVLLSRSGHQVGRKRVMRLGAVVLGTNYLNGIRVRLAILRISSARDAE
jgi:hypothetical protein